MSKPSLRGLPLVVCVLGSLLWSRVVEAATFPADNKWTPLTQQSIGLADPNNDGSNLGKEIVGSAAFPAMYIYQDGTDLFVRLRVDDTPTGNADGSGTLNPSGWGVLIDTDNTFADYEFSLLLSGKTNDLDIQLGQNTTKEGLGKPNDNAETLLAASTLDYTSGTGNVRIVSAGMNFSNDADFFIDFAFPLNTFLTKTGITVDSSLVIWGGTSSSAQSISVDLAGSPNLAAGSLTLAASDPLKLAELVDTDGDGVADGNDTMPNNSSVCHDTDNDTCDECATGTVLATNNDGTDSDSDGLCDAGDTDDDNDGVSDVDEAMVNTSPTDPAKCGDSDADTCDDCAVGVDQFGAMADNKPNADGLDSDSDGKCNAGDTDDDNDGVSDTNDAMPLDNKLCHDTDTDGCDECATGTVLATNNDGTDTDSDGKCNVGDTDDDNDGVADTNDAMPLDNKLCHDADTDGCDECATGTVLATNNDGTDSDSDGKCNAGDTDDDNDGVSDATETTNGTSPTDATKCGDSDADTCDDCAVGVDQFGAMADNKPNADGLDSDLDGKCNAGDTDDDNDGVTDVDETANGTSTTDATTCGDSDADTCDDCVVGVDQFGAMADNTPNADGADIDSDGKCDAGDTDDDNDGVSDEIETTNGTSTTDPTTCGDSDADTCDDCVVGVDQFGDKSDVLANNDGADSDSDGKCDIGDDSDDDGVSDADELKNHTDPNDGDSDDDGVVDGDEKNWDQDSDADGLINALDPDSDNDGLYDGTELGLDCSHAATDAGKHHCRADVDPATTTDPLNPDTDDGGVTDGSEDANLDGNVDAGHIDPNNKEDDAGGKDGDNDGLSDELEGFLGSNLNDADTDDDGVLDGDEANPSDDTDGDHLINVLDVDSDNDGLYDGTETGNVCDNKDTNAGPPSHCVADGDGGESKTSPINPDTDFGGVKDGSEDPNLNGMTDTDETNPNNSEDDSIVDSDGDGLSDALEVTLKSDPNDGDSDDDGVRDGDEPNPSDDLDGDTKSNIIDEDSDGDGLFDGTELGNTCDDPDTDTTKNRCTPDADNGATTTLMLDADTDDGGVSDGTEDVNHDGEVSVNERDPNDKTDDKDCHLDSECGDTKSGMVCDSKECVAGCRGTDGNGCPDGEQCTSMNATVGECVMPTSGAGGGGAGGGGAGGGGNDDVFAQGGWICSMRSPGPSNDLGWLIAAVGAIGAVVRRRRRRAAMVAGAIVVATNSSAAAAEQEPQALDRFRPSWAGDRFFGITSPYAAGDVAVHGRLLMEFAHRPVSLVRDDGQTVTSLGAVVANQVLVHANATFALWNRLAVNLDLPAATSQTGDSPVVNGTTYTSPLGSAIGDLRVGLRGRIYGENGGPVQLGITGYLWVPTGDQDSGSFMSNGTVRALPMVSAGGTIDRFIWGADVGPDLRKSQVFANVQQGKTMTWGAGAGYLLGDRKHIQLNGELLGSVVVEDMVRRNLNIEALAGARWRFVDNFVTSGSVGSGIAQGLGTPQMRATIGIEYSPLARSKPLDSDGDGIADAQDACPEKAGLANRDPNLHGCPLVAPVDSDGDGIPDSQDACPSLTGVASSDQSKNGCPLPLDSDGDGIPDSQDACPSLTGVASSDPGKNGCPADTDSDKILDPVDACPKDPGNPSTDPKKNGCPEVQVTETEIVINGRIEFDSAKSSIRRESDALIDKVANIMREHAEMELIEVQGHTDDVGGKGPNKQLSKERAQSVAAALTKLGIDKKRLTSKGFGQDVPLVANDSDERRQQNRRVEFKILKRKQ